MNEHLNTTQIVTVPLSGSVTMSSREIADLTGSSHDNVLKTIRALVAKGVVSGNETPYTHAQNGQTYKEFLLNYRNTMIVVSGYSPELRARIIDRWMELEEGSRRQPALDFSDPRVVLGVIGHLQGEVAKKDEIIEEQGGRLKKLDRLEGAKGSMCISDAAKTLAVKRDFLFSFLQTRRWIFKRTGSKNWLAYDNVRHAGYMEHDDHLYMDNEGRERVSTQALVTAKGLVKLADLLEKPLH
ncbi:MAG: phage regulatory protein/antirepressor Ant [Proteobacteria bacterium]|nr:phage regulatory protein/antirepressor Ant [Pseudomonadota bacterium]